MHTVALVFNSVLKKHYNQILRKKQLKIFTSLSQNEEKQKKFKKPVIKTRKKSFIFKFHHQDFFLSTARPPKNVSASSPQTSCLYLLFCSVSCNGTLKKPKRKNTQKVTLNYDCVWEKDHGPCVHTHSPWWVPYIITLLTITESAIYTLSKMHVKTVFEYFIWTSVARCCDRGAICAVPPQ